MAAYKDGTYHIRLEVLDYSISLSFSLDNFVSRSFQGNLDVSPAYNLVPPRQLRMIKVVRYVVEFENFGETNGVQIPNNDCILLLECFAPLLPTTFKLELLWQFNAMLAINDHELIVLDFIPILQLCPLEVFLHIHRGEEDLLALTAIPHLKKLCLHALHNFLFQFPDDVFVAINHTLHNVHLKRLHPKQEWGSTSVLELPLDSCKLFIVRDSHRIAFTPVVNMGHSGPELLTPVEALQRFGTDSGWFPSTRGHILGLARPGGWAVFLLLLAWAPLPDAVTPNAAMSGIAMDIANGMPQVDWARLCVSDCKIQFSRQFSNSVFVMV